MVKEIPLQNGMVALVDDEDFERVNKHIWYCNITTKSLKVASIKDGKEILLGRLIMNCDDADKVVYFKNKDIENLDFRKTNLIVDSSTVRPRFKRSSRGSSSKYKGVFQVKGKDRWRSIIRVENKNIHLGYFSNEDDAAKAYNKASLKFFGKNAYRNVIGEDNSVKNVNFRKDVPSQKRRAIGLSGFRGVTFENGKWVACLKSKGKKFYLGRHSNSLEAAKAYDQKAYEIYGDKAILNFPELIDEYKQAFQRGETN